MSLEQITLFSAVPAGAIETLFDEQNQPMFKRADLGRYLGITDIRTSSYRNITTISRHEIGVSSKQVLGRSKNSTDLFVTMDGAIEITVRSRKPKAVALAKCRKITGWARETLSSLGG